MEPIRVVLLPGSVLPAQAAYGALIAALGPDVVPVAKDLELYDGDEPPPGWSLDTEIKGQLGTYTDPKGPDLARDLAGMLDQDLQAARGTR